jgi:hypothetical protein
MRRALLLLALVAACAVAGTARADGDPASDYLLSSQVFFPLDVKIPQADQDELVATLAAANRAGYKIRAAIIWSAYDLGAVTALWRQPQTYARFLATEIRFVYSHRLLIVMPDGFGFAWHGHADADEQALLKKIPITPTPSGLADAAKRAVVELAGAEGITVKAGGPNGTSRTTQRVIIVLVVVAAIVVLVLLRLLLRGRRKPA